MSHELFENFDLEETNNKSLLKNKRKSDNIKSNVNNKTKDTKSNNDLNTKEVPSNLTLTENKTLNTINKNSNTNNKHEVKSSLNNFINPDKLIDNRLNGLIDNPDLLKGSDEIKKMGQKTFNVTGCNHEVFMPIKYDFNCKYYIINRQ
jgi:hypothetical protein